MPSAQAASKNDEPVWDMPMYRLSFTVQPLLAWAAKASISARRCSLVRRVQEMFDWPPSYSMQSVASAGLAASIGELVFRT